MSSFEVPELETFTPEKTYRVLGISYVAMRGENGVRLDLSETGVLAIAQNPQLPPLLSRMGAFIAEHGHYRATIDVEDPEPSSILRVGEPALKTALSGYKNISLASVYKPDAVPEVIVKAYDHDRKSALFQFYLGAWLHGKLARAEDGVNSAAQLALFRSASGLMEHRTTVMEYLPGENLYSITSRLGSGDTHVENIAEVERIAILASQQLRDKIARITGWRGSIIANDLSNHKNIIDPDPETATPDNMPERAYGVIDQPVVKNHSFVLQTMARHIPSIKRDQVLTENPATSSL
jgi:hypothetical protein